MSAPEEKTEDNKDFTDINKTWWIEALPAFIRPYFYLARMDRPIGAWLLLFPCWFSYTLAALPNAPLDFEKIRPYFYFVFGAMIMRSAGCVINDLWDRKLDRSVERTKNRPIASGKVSIIGALIFLGLLLALGLWILVQFNIETIFLGFAAIIPVILYPLAKRYTYWPQLVLGMTFNWGALIGWCAFYGTLHWQAFAIYVGCVFWTLGYDTVYAYQDREDDKKIGIKSTALLFGDRGKLIVGLFYALALLAMNIAFQTLWIALPLLHFLWQIKSWDPESQASSLAMFKANRLAGLLILIAILAGIWTGY